MNIRTELAGFLSALLSVYIICIFAYIVLQMVLSFGVRIPYNRGVSGAVGFLRDVSEPYLRIFRRLGLRIGPLDLSPIVALIVLNVVGSIVVSLIRP